MFLKRALICIFGVWLLLLAGLPARAGACHGPERSAEMAMIAPETHCGEHEAAVPPADPVKDETGSAGPDPFCCCSALAKAIAPCAGETCRGLTAQGACGRIADTGAPSGKTAPEPPPPKA